MAPTTDINPSQDRQVFMSGDMNRRIIRVPRAEKLGLTADQLIEVYPALEYKFVDGYLVIDDHRRKLDAAYFEKHGEAMGLVRDDGGWEDDLAGQWRPSESAEEWLRKHTMFDSPNGFTEVGYVAPDTGAVFAAVSAAVLAEDTEKLLEIYQDEESSHARQEVLDHVKEAIQTLDDRKEAREQELEAARAEGQGAPNVDKEPAAT